MVKHLVGCSNEYPTRGCLFQTAPIFQGGFVNKFVFLEINGSFLVRIKI